VLPPETVEAELIEEDPIEQAVDILSEVFPTGNREQTLRIVKALRGWSGPLPPPDELREYGLAAPGAVEIILADFERRSEIEAEATRHQMSSMDRELAIQEAEQKLRAKESDSDVGMRAWAQRAGVGFVILTCAGAGWTLAFAPIASDGARVAAAGLWFLPLIVFGVTVLLRGRYSDNERDVIMETLPRIAEAMSRRTKQPSEDPALDPREET
jgi:hypothetical protein